MPDAISALGANPLLQQGSNRTQAVTTDTPTVDPALLEQPDDFDQDMFLQLLVAQLKYQNPLDPMDSNQFMAQSAQFTTVEKLEELTSKLSETLANDRLGTATGMIGRDVTFQRPDGGTTTQTVQGVRFAALGPSLVLGDGSEIGMADILEVSARL